MAPGLDASTAAYCFLDWDVNQHRTKLATAAAFVHATNARYGFSSRDLRHLGGSETCRIVDLITTDHEWSAKVMSGDNQPVHVVVRPPAAGNRVVVKLYWDVAPLACENFATLCANGGASLSSSLLSNSENNNKKAKPAPMGECGKPLTYRQSTVHRIVPGFVIQGGDFVFGNGTGGESIYNEKKFKDERAGLLLKHDRRGVLSMGNSGKNSNSSQWFITLAAAPQCDGKHVIFGHVVSGWEVLAAVEQECGSTTGDGTPPQQTVTITDCGIWTPLVSPASGYWYDQPDEESFTGVSPVFMVRPRVAVLAPNVSVLAKIAKALRGCCTVTELNSEELDSLDAQVERIGELLGQFQVDVVFVAPACQPVMSSLQLPESWTSVDMTMDQVVLTAKPTEALDVIRSQSWLARCTYWQLDDMI